MKNTLYVARNALASSRRIGEEILIMTADNSTLFTLDEIASLIWEAADGVRPLNQVVEREICDKFDVELEIALRDAETVVRALAAHGVFELSDSPLANLGKSS